MPGMITPSTVHRAGSRLPCNAGFPYVVRTRVHVSQPLWIELPYTGDVSLHHVLKARPQVRQQVAPVTEGGESNEQRGGHHTTNCTSNKWHITTQLHRNVLIIIIWLLEGSALVVMVSEFLW